MPNCNLSKDDLNEFEEEYNIMVCKLITKNDLQYDLTSTQNF